jgi:hypothetical protein
MVREKITRNKARLAKLRFDDNLETKKTNNRKSAPRSLAPDGPRRRNPVRSSRAMTIYESSVEGSLEGLLEGLVEGCVEGLVEGSLEGSVDGSLDGFVFNDGLLEGSLDGFVLNDGLLEGLVEESMNTPPINADSINKQDFYAQHNNDCKVCNLGGDLLCCDKCTLVFHLQCVCPKLKEVPPGDWMCAYCWLGWEEGWEGLAQSNTGVQGGGADVKGVYEGYSGSNQTLLRRQPFRNVSHDGQDFAPDVAAHDDDRDWDHGRPQVSSRAGASIQNNSSKSGTCKQVGSHC